MTDNQTLQTDTCPNCQHQQHAPGVECEGLVNHNGDRHWHRCLCLKRAGADSSCHPLMTCQGGSLGYSDIWHLQRGHTLQGADGPVTPDVLTAVPVSSPPPDQTALREAIDGALHRVLDSNLGKGAWTRLRAKATDAVLAVLPPPADRAAVLQWAADQIDAETRQLKADEVLEPEKFRPCRDASAQLRRLAAEAEQPDTEMQAHPPIHAWRVETRDPLADQWAPGSHFAHRPNAVERWETANRTAPLWNDGTPVERRIVRETTTYTVDTEHTPEAAQEA